MLFIQGVGLHGAGWRPQVDSLSKSFSCVSYDNRGTGPNSPNDGPLEISFQQLVDDAIRALDAAEFSSAHLVGHSLGGLIALQVALKSPRRVRSLSLLCTFANGKAVGPLTRRLMWFGFRSRCGSRVARRRAFLNLVLPPKPRTDAELDRLAADYEPLFGHDLADQSPAVKGQMAAMRATDLTNQLSLIKNIPALVVSAEHDLIAPPKLGRALAAGISGSKFVELADAAHGCTISDAARVNALLLDHLQGADKFIRKINPV